VRLSRWYTIELPIETDVKSLIEQLEKSAHIECVGKKSKVYHDYYPNNSEYLQGRQWATDKINSPLAYDFTQGSSDVVVAVLGHGVHWQHEDLINNIYRHPSCGPNEVAPGGPEWQQYAANHPEQTLSGIQWAACHETHIAGIIAAETNNGQGVASTAPGCKILPVKFCNTSDDFNDPNINRNPITEAFEYAAITAVDYYNIPVKVINLSWNGGYDPQLEDIIDEASYNRGILVVVSSGNLHPGEEYPYRSDWPASCPYVGPKDQFLCIP